MSERRPTDFSDTLIEQALSREPDSAVAAQTFERILADIADRPQRRPGLRQVVVSGVIPRPRLGLGWLALAALLIGILLAVAVLAGGPKTRPVLGVLPTTVPTSRPTVVARATDELRPTLPPDCLTLPPDAVQATSPGGSLAAPAPAPKGAPASGLIAYAARSAILAYNPSTGTTMQIATLSTTPPDLVLGKLTWSPDGRRLAFALGRGTTTDGVAVDVLWCDLMVMNADGSGLTSLATMVVDTRDSVENILWSLDGRSIAYNTGGFSDFLSNVTLDGPGRELPGTNGCWGAAWSPDGARIACLGGGAITTVASGEFVPMNLYPNGGSRSSDEPVWAADSQSITALGQSAQDRSTAYRVAVDGTVLGSTDLPGSTAWTPGPDLSPDGTRVLARVCPTPCADDVEYQIAPVDGSPAISLGRGYSAVWSGDGSKVALITADGIVVAEASDASKNLIARVTSVSFVSWSPDQRQLLYSLGNGELWTVPATGGEATLIDKGPASTGSEGVAWQPFWP